MRPTLGLSHLPDDALVSIALLSGMQAFLNAACVSWSWSLGEDRAGVFQKIASNTLKVQKIRSICSKQLRSTSKTKKAVLKTLSAHKKALIFRSELAITETYTLLRHSDSVAGVKSIMKKWNIPLQAAHINYRSSQVWEANTLLNFSARCGRYRVSSFLIQLGADVNLPDIGGFTPLTNACWRGDVRLVNLLLENGADCHVLGSSSYGSDRHQLLTPLGWAVARNHSSVVSVIQRHSIALDKLAATISSDSAAAL
jgi:hypothetical protein